MNDNYKKVSNPLTIVAIFAGIAELAGTIVAIGLKDSEVLHIFIWFVMGFPVLLVVLFFIVLMVKPHSFYAPSDYRQDATFLKAQKLSNESLHEIDAGLLELDRNLNDMELNMRSFLKEIKDKEELISNVDLVEDAEASVDELMQKLVGEGVGAGVSEGVSASDAGNLREDSREIDKTLKRASTKMRENTRARPRPLPGRREKGSDGETKEMTTKESDGDRDVSKHSEPMKIVRDDQGDDRKLYPTDLSIGLESVNHTRNLIGDLRGAVARANVYLGQLSDKEELGGVLDVNEADIAGHTNSSRVS